jgi:hypothetical protein
MPVPMSSPDTMDAGELVRQTSAMNITEQSWLESTEKVWESFVIVLELANNVSSIRCRLSKKYAWVIAVFYTAARDSNSTVSNSY